MGLPPSGRYGHSVTHKSDLSQPTTENISGPDPKNFEILRSHFLGELACLVVKYPDAKNYEGYKILVLRDTTEEDVRNLSELDPHFSEDGKVIARFKPTKDGYDDAISYMDFKEKG